MKGTSMKKTFTFLFALILVSQIVFAQSTTVKWPMRGLVRVYFTQPVDNSFSNAINATYLNNVIFDTLAAYINRAKYTIDICQYEYITYTGDPIYTAINNAKTRGVKIRYIQDSSYSTKNTGVKKLNSAIHVLTSPLNTGNYGICHNKFVIIDELAADSTKAIVWTGSPDWDLAMSQGDYNNVIIFQSKVLAKAFTHEFNIMWGDTTHGGAPNKTASKFGPDKANSGTHIFHIGGSEVDLYFSPSDGVNTQIINNIKSANVDLYCGMFTFTETTNATDIVSQKTAGAFAAAILDKYSSGTYTPYTTTLPNGLGTNFVGYNNSNYLYHNKYLIVNPSAPCYDPKVLTGSHNWTASADSKNDENTVIVHNDTVANLYLQSFAGDFKAIKGTALTKVNNPCVTGINEINTIDNSVYVYPNPASEGSHVYLNVNLNQNLNNAKLFVFDILGNKLKEVLIGQQTAVDCGVQSKGMFFYQLINNNELIKAGKFIVQ